ncbi:MAG TPA: hypothetical protein EYN08_02075 [Gammaproteobacteria bacterium]|nr:hypothetical protein [Gammaproteobacteria bacterium]
MAFLDNSGDIILDAVLTDTGRMRLAKGDGSFKIAKFAFGDDEINYGLYDKDHASGSAYYDLELLQTPVLEAFTNNMSSMKSKLISIPRTNILYLPVLKLEKTQSSTQMYDLGSTESFLVAVDKDTEEAPCNPGGGVIGGQAGIIKGFTPGDGSSYINIHQGLDTDDISPVHGLDPDLREHQYIIEIDNRLGSIVSSKGVIASVSYIDDDSIASYYLSSATNTSFVADIGSTLTVEVSNDIGQQVIKGPRGTSLNFKISAGTDLNTSTTLFTRLGSLTTILGSTYYYIDSIVRVTGATTGYRIDIPVRFIKFKE